MKEMVAVICKCAKHNKLFGIRFDQINSRTWEYAWAFPLKKGLDRRDQGFLQCCEESLRKTLTIPVARIAVSKNFSCAPADTYPVGISVP